MPPSKTSNCAKHNEKYFFFEATQFHFPAEIKSSIYMKRATQLLFSLLDYEFLNTYIYVETASRKSSIKLSSKLSKYQIIGSTSFALIEGYFILLPKRSGSRFRSVNFTQTGQQKKISPKNIWWGKKKMPEKLKAKWGMKKKKTFLDKKSNFQSKSIFIISICCVFNKLSRTFGFLFFFFSEKSSGHKHKKKPSNQKKNTVINIFFLRFFLSRCVVSVHPPLFGSFCSQTTST